MEDTLWEVILSSSQILCPSLNPYSIGRYSMRENPVDACVEMIMS